MRALDDRAARMLLAALIEPGDADLADLIAETDAIAAVHRLWAGDVAERLRRLTAPALAAGSEYGARAAALMDATAAVGARVLVPGDPEWPQQLSDLARLDIADEPHLRPPWCLWVRGTGDLAAATRQAVTVTGSRAATEYGQHLADDIAADLAEAGWTVVSGGGFGIDRAAHLGALARGGTTIAVVASGVSAPYPSANTPMFDRIADRGGLLVSEWPPDASATRHRLLLRARTLAALTAGTVVVEASARSGSRSIARYATALGREVMFTPGPVTSSQSAGVHQIAREGWGARLVTCASEVIDDLTGTPPPRSPGSQRRPFENLTAAQQSLIEVLPVGYLVGTDRIAAASGMPAAVAAEQLEYLHRSGWVDRIDRLWRLARQPDPIAGPGPTAS